LKAITEGSSRSLLIIVGCGTLFAGLAAVVGSWHNLAVVEKVGAIVFLVLLTVSPFRAISYFRGGRNPLGPYGGLITGYVITMLALTSLVFR
jgi:hypothetical protein